MKHQDRSRCFSSRFVLLFKLFLLSFLLLFSWPGQVSAFNSVEGAIAWAEGQGVGDNWDEECGQEWAYWCLHFVGHCYLQVPAGDYSAIDAWYRDDDKYGPQMTDYDPPRGAMVFFYVSGVWGHVGLACGDGNMWHAWIDGIRHDAISNYYGYTYLGWRWPQTWTDDEPGGECGITVGPGTTTIDDSSACFVRYGTPSYWHGQSSGYSGYSWWTYTTNESSPDNYGKWFLNVTHAGNYEVSAYIPHVNATSEQSTYKIWHNGSASYRTINQFNTYGWILLGTYYFSASSDQAVRLNDNTGEPCCSNMVGFDAIELTSVTGVEVREITAEMIDGEMAVRWRTSLEQGNAGWNLYRALGVSEEYEAVNDELIEPYQYEYAFFDPDVEYETIHCYRLEAIDLEGNGQFYGPRCVTPRLAQSEDGEGFIGSDQGETEDSEEASAPVDDEKEDDSPACGF